MNSWDKKCIRGKMTLVAISGIGVFGYHENCNSEYLTYRMCQVTQEQKFVWRQM